MYRGSANVVLSAEQAIHILRNMPPGQSKVKFLAVLVNRYHVKAGSGLDPYPRTPQEGAIELLKEAGFTQCGLVSAVEVVAQKVGWIEFDGTPTGVNPNMWVRTHRQLQRQASRPCECPACTAQTQNAPA